MQEATKEKQKNVTYTFLLDKETSEKFEYVLRCKGYINISDYFDVQIKDFIKNFITTNHTTDTKSKCVFCDEYIFWVFDKIKDLWIPIETETNLPHLERCPDFQFLNGKRRKNPTYYQIR